MRNAAISEAPAEIKASKGPEPAFDEKAEIEDLSATRGWKTKRVRRKQSKLKMKWRTGYFQIHSESVSSQSVICESHLFLNQSINQSLKPTNTMDH